MRRIVIPLLLSMSMLTACGGAAELTPKQRYVQALNQRLEGNSQGYQDTLIALAHEVPDTRTGRRARATLSSGWLTNAALLGAAGLAVLEVMSANLEDLGYPQLPGVEPEGPWPGGERPGPGAELEALLHKQQAHFAQRKRYCVTFQECGWEAPPDSPYFFYLSLDEVTGGGGVADPSLLRLQAEAALADLNVKPQVTQDTFVALAVGDANADGELEIWMVTPTDGVVPLIQAAP